MPAGVAPWACDACYFEGSAEELLAEIREQAEAAWESWPDFLREVVTFPVAGVAFRRLAVPLLESGFSLGIVEGLARLVNERRWRPASEGELVEALAASARSAARLREAA